MAVFINILRFYVGSLVLTASLSTMILSDAVVTTRVKNMTWATPAEGTRIAYNRSCDMDGPATQCKTKNATCEIDGNATNCLCKEEKYHDSKSDTCKPRPVAPKPIKLSTEDIDTNELTIHWSAGDDSSFTVILKWIPPSIDNNSTFRHTWDDIHNRHKITGLRSGTKYIFYIYLEKENVTTILLNSASVFTKPLPIQYITFDSYGENYTTVEWWNDPERPCTSYYVFVNEALVAIVPRHGNTSIYNVTNLTGGTGYNIEVISHVQGQNSIPFRDVFYTRPKPVTSATVTDIGTHSITVQLSNEDEGEDEKYRFYVFPNTSLEVENTITSTNKTNTISGLDPGTLYTIRIYTFYKDHESERFRTIIEYTRPLPPMNLNATKILENSLNLQWTMTDRRFDEYILEYSTLDGMDNITISIKNTTVLSYPIRNLKSGSGYLFRLYSAMNGTKSLESAVYEVYTKPTGSSEPTLTQRMDTSISIQFPDDNNSYTSYQINGQLYDRNNGYITIQNLTAGQYHTFTIFTVANYTELSLNSTTFKNFTLPAPPSNIMFPGELLHETILNVEWENVTEGNADGYFVQFTVGDSIIEEFNDTSFANFFEFTNLTAGVRYNVTIYSFWNGERSYRTLEGSTYTRPPAPEVAIIGVTETSLTLDITDELWEGYRIIVNPGVQDDTDQLEFISEELPYEIRDLEAGTEYTVEVFSMIGGIVGENGLQVSSYTKPDRVRIDSIQADKKETNISSLALTWEKPGMGSVDWYELEIMCTSPNEPENLLLDFTKRTTETKASVWGLKPGTFCTINITTHVGNQTGAMTQKRVEWITDEIAPEQVQDIKIETKARSLKLLWSKPTKPNGIIRKYAVDVIDLKQNCSFNRTLFTCTNCLETSDSSCGEESASDPWTTGPCNESSHVYFRTFEDIDTLDYNVTDLHPNRNYMVVVTPFSRCYGQSSLLVNRTKQDAPGNVRSLSLDTERNITKPRSIEVTWTDPKPMDLNGILTAFYVTYTGVSQIDNITVTRKIGVEQRSFIIHDIVPGSYNIGVYASTKAGNGSKSWLSITVPPGVPIFTEESPNVPLLKESTTSSPSATQIPIQLAIDFLCNQSNGKPKYIGLIVAADSQATDKPFIGSRDDFDVRNKTYKTWFEIKSMQNPQPYITSETNWNPCKKRRIRSTEGQSETFTIGTQGDCSGVAPDTYCNGKLKPGTSYRVKAFCCTDGGCTETMYSNVVKTKEPINKATIVGSVLFVVAVTAVAICTVIFLRRKQAACFAKSAENGTTNKLSEPIEAIELAYRSRSSTVSRLYPVPVSEFPDYVDKQKKDNGLLFSEAYKMIKEYSPQHQMSIAKSQICRSKNRFMNILPFDHSRVKLLPLDAEERTDYINASYIPGNNSRTEYIATQGPMPSTFIDFWRMVWEQNVEIIVMLTKLFEKGRNKCYKYWPNQNEPQFYGDISVSVMFESNLSDHTIRIMELKLTGEKRTVKQFSFLKWPDMGRPEYPHLLLEFVKSVQQNKSTRSEGRPMVVHCSAGVGPTGTFIAVDHLLQHIRDHDEIDIYNLVLEMRNNRCNMVQTEAQYIYIHECIREFIWNDDQEDDFDDDDNDIQHIYTNTQQEDGYENI